MRSAELCIVASAGRGDSSGSCPLSSGSCPLSASSRVCCGCVFLQGFVAAALEHFWSSGPGLKDDKQLQAVLDGCDQGHDMQPLVQNGPSSPPAAFQDHSNGHQHVSQQAPACYHSMAHEVSHCWRL